MATDIRDASLLYFVPEVIASDLEIIAISLAIDPELQAVGAAIIEANILPRISEQPEWVLDELAWAFRLNQLQIWDSATIEGKRALLVNIFEVRKKSGTRFAVRRVFDLMVRGGGRAVHLSTSTLRRRGRDHARSAAANLGADPPFRARAFAADGVCRRVGSQRAHACICGGYDGASRHH